MAMFKGMKKVCISVVLLMTTINCVAQLKPNSIGVAYIIAETKDSYEFKIVLPVQTLEHTNVNSQDEEHKTDTIPYTGYITFFDAKGKLASLMPHPDKKEVIVVERWCNRQGVDHYRPTLRMTVLKMWLKRTVKNVDDLQGIACFIIANQKNLKIPAPENPVAGGVRFRGDFNDDGKADCHVWICYDKDNCSAKTNFLDINLQVGAVYYPLHCCD